MNDYKIAYGVSNASQIMSTQEIDKLIADSLKVKPSKAPTTASKPATPNKGLRDAFKHLKAKTTTTINTSDAFAHLKSKASKPTESKNDPFAHIRGGK